MMTEKPVNGQPDGQDDLLMSQYRNQKLSLEEASRQLRYKESWPQISIIKPGGKGLVTVWSVEQDIDSKKHFKKGDNYVIWHKPRIIEDGSQVYDKYNRYYYVFDKKDFYEYINKFKALIDINKIYNEKGNWFCIFTKKIYD